MYCSLYVLIKLWNW